VVTGIPPFVIREPNLLAPTLSIRTVGHQIGALLQTGYSRRVSDASSSIYGCLPPPFEDPLNSNSETRLSVPLQFPSVPGKWSHSYPSTSPSPSTASAPSLPPLLQSDLPRQSSVDYSSSYSTSSTGEPDVQRRWPFRSPNRSRTTFNTSPSFRTPVHLTPGSTISVEASYRTAKSSPMSLTQRSPPSISPETNPSAPSPLMRTAEHQTQVQTGYSRRVSDGPLSAYWRLPPLWEVPLKNIPVPLSSSSSSMSRTNASSPQQQWPLGDPKRAPETLITFPSVDGNPLRTQSISTKVPNTVASQYSSAAVLLPQSRKWESVSPAVLESLEEVARHSHGLLQLAADGSVSAANLEGLVCRVITGPLHKIKDGHFRDAFLTVYRLFATSKRLFKILKQRFRPTALGRSRYK
jgi:hypothetical protein